MFRKKFNLKTPEEILRVKEACIIISDIFRDIHAMSLEDMSTWDLDSFIDNAINRKNARAAFKTVPGYHHASCISINNEILHGVPDKKKIIKYGDIVKIDIGVALNGYFGDSCYTFSVKDIPDNARKLVLATMESLNRGIAVIRPGSRTGDIGHAIQQYAEPMGYSIVRNFTGHGTGFHLHEPPPVPHYGKKGTGTLIEEGLVLAVEPMINEGTHETVTLDDGWTTVTRDGKLSAQFEHTVAATNYGVEILTDLDL